MGNSKAFMLPGGPLLPFNPAISFVPTWQDYCDFLRLDALRGLGILVSVRFDYQTNGISRYRTFCVYSV